MLFQNAFSTSEELGWMKSWEYFAINIPRWHKISAFEDFNTEISVLAVLSDPLLE